MIKKRKPAYGLFAVALVLLCVLGYYLSALYILPDVNLFTIGTSITYLVHHPLQNYWNDKSLACIALGFLAWILFVSWYTYYYRNFHFGAEYGSADWGNVKEMCARLRSKNELKNRALTENLEISKDALSNNNMIVVGSAGTGKSTGLVWPDILKMACSMVIVDVKGDLLRLFGNYLKYHGQIVRSINVVQPEFSDHYDPFHHIEKEEDLVRLITNLQTAVKPPDAFKGDPFWDDGCALYLQSMFYFEWLDARNAGRKPSMNNILTLVNLESQKVELGEDVTVSKLQVKMDRLADQYGPGYPPVRDYRKLKEGASETVRSIIIMVNAMLKLCETAALKRIFEDDDLDFASFGLGVDGNLQRKTFLFLVIPDNDTSYNFLVSMIYTQMFQILMRTADTICHGPLPIEVRFKMDEYYAGCRPNDPEKLMGVIRSRNITMDIFVQSISQLKTIHKGDSWNTLFDNAAIFLFLGSGPAAKDTHQYFSDLLGKMTIDKRTDGMRKGNHGDASLNNDQQGRELMTADEVKRLHRKKCIVFLEGEHPVIDWKLRPFKPATKEFKLAKKLGLYQNPVKVIFDEETLTYHTISNKASFKCLDPKEVNFYENKAQHDTSIKIFHVAEEQFLYMNFDEKVPDEKELEQQFQEFLKGYQEEAPVESQEETEPRDTSGTIYDWIKRFFAEMAPAAQEEVLLGLEEGLTEEQIKDYFFLEPGQMQMKRRLYKIAKERGL